MTGGSSEAHDRARAPIRPAADRSCSAKRRLQDQYRRSGSDDYRLTHGRLDLGGAAAEPLAPICAHALDQRHERLSLLGQRVLDARGDLGIGLTPDDPLLLEGAEPERQRPRADALKRALELTEPGPALGEVADHEQRPLAAHDLGGAADRTGAIRDHRKSDDSAMLQQLKRAVRGGSAMRGAGRYARGGSAM